MTVNGRIDYLAAAKTRQQGMGAYVEALGTAVEALADAEDNDETAAMLATIRVTNAQITANLTVGRNEILIDIAESLRALVNRLDANAKFDYGSTA